MEIAKERLLLRSRFDAICSKYPPWNEQPIEKRETFARRMERNCLEVVVEECKRDGIDRRFTEKKFIERYSSLCARVMTNLDINGSVGSTYLLDGLLNGSIDSYTVANLDSYALCPSASQSERDTIKLRQEQKIIKKVSRAYWCRKCGGNETIPLEYQGKAADEDSSRSIKCVLCGYIWRRS